MPLTDEPRSRYYHLQTGEQWWICEGCGQILGKLKADGTLERRQAGNIETIDPQHKTLITLACACRHTNLLWLTRGKGGNENGSIG